MEKFIAFFEIPAADFHRAVGFYETVLDIKLAVSEYEEEKMACFMEQGGAVGAVSWAPDFLPSGAGNADSFLLRRDRRQVAGTCPAERWESHYSRDED